MEQALTLIWHAIRDLSLYSRICLDIQIRGNRKKHLEMVRIQMFRISINTPTCND